MQKKLYNGHRFNVPEKDNSQEKTNVNKFERTRGVEKHLPIALTKFVTGVAQYFRSTPEIVFTGLLGVLCITLMGCFMVEVREGWLEHLVLYTMTVAKPGENKSTVLKALLGSLEAAIDRYNNLNHDLYLQAEITCKIVKKQLARLMKKAEADEAEPSDVYNKTKELEEAEAQLNGLKPLMLSADDVTPEKLAELLAANHEKLAIAVSEGSFLQVASGLYNKGNSNIDLLLHAINGERYSQHRISRESVILKTPLLALVLYVQPTVLEESLTNSTFMQRGLMARFLIEYPESQVGKRDFMTDQPMYSNKAYAALIHCLMDIFFSLNNSDPKIVSLSKEADIELRKFQCLIEENMLGELDDVKEFCCKIAGMTARIAAVLHICDIVLDYGKDGLTGTDIDTVTAKISDTEVSADMTRHAIEIAKHYIGEARYIYNTFGMKKDNAESYEEKILNHLREAVRKQNKNLRKEEREHGLYYIDQRGLERIFHKVKTDPEYERFMQAVEALVNDGYLSQESNKYYFNPEIFGCADEDYRFASESYTDNTVASEPCKDIFVAPEPCEVIYGSYEEYETDAYDAYKNMSQDELAALYEDLARRPLVG